MFARSHFFRSPAILSVRVRTFNEPTVFVITRNPSLAGAVANFFRQSNDHRTTIWLSSVASACRRLKASSSAMVILDGGTDEALRQLHAAAPGLRVVILENNGIRL
ncbi:MAG TPA: hypothetical protein VIO38_08870 [Rariglobus sp.]